MYVGSCQSDDERPGEAMDAFCNACHYPCFSEKEEEPQPPERSQIISSDRISESTVARMAANLLSGNPTVHMYGEDWTVNAPELSVLVARAIAFEVQRTAGGYLYSGLSASLLESLRKELRTFPAASEAEPPALWQHAVKECNEAHAALDSAGVTKTISVRMREDNGLQKISLGLADRVCALRDTLRALVVEARRRAPSHGVQDWDWLLGALAALAFPAVATPADEPPAVHSRGQEKSGRRTALGEDSQDASEKSGPSV